MKKIEILAAVRNEAENIRMLVEEFKQINIEDINLVLTFIEDGSTDDTIDVLRELSSKNGNINYFVLDNPYGQGYALSFGIYKSTADAVITIDADGSHPLHVSVQMIYKYLEGYDIVQGHRTEFKRTSVWRNIFSKLFSNLFSFLIGLDLKEQNVHFRLMSKKAYTIFKKNRRWWKSVRININKSKMRSFILHFVAPERSIGVSKLGFLRLTKAAFIMYYNLVSGSRFIFFNMLFFSPLVIWFNSIIFMLCLGCFFVNLSIYAIINHDTFTKSKVVEENINA